MARKKKTGEERNEAENFEALLSIIEKQLEALEGGELSLEHSLQAYEQGVRALKRCYGLLKAAEGKIELLTKMEDEPRSVEFDPDTGTPQSVKPRATRAEGNEDDGADGDDKMMF